MEAVGIRITATYIRLAIPLALAAMFWLAATRAHATFPGKNGKIVFTRVEPNQTYDLYTVNPDGSGLSRLTNSDDLARDAGGDFGPKWSPDGTKLLFRRGRPDGRGIFRMNADGSGLTQLTDGSGSDPVWSPDGSKIAFNSCTQTSCYVSTMNIDGSEQRALAPGINPVWSPDGQRIAFEGGGIRVMNIDGFGDTRLATGSYPVWDHGNKIAFIRQAGDGGADGLFFINADGTGETRIETTTRLPFPDDWSPDASKLLYESPDGLFTVSAAGAFETKVAAGSGPAVWSPDGSKVVYSGNGGISLATADGGDVRNLTSGSFSDFEPDWQPIPAPKRADYKNANRFCKAEQAFWADQFSQHYRNLGQCISASK